MSKEAISLLEGFFIKDPEQRLGSGPDGVQKIKDHPFFKTIDWDAILEKKIKPPFTPKMKSPGDTRYIDPEFTGCTPKDSLTTGESIPNSENPYGGFSYDPNKEGE